MKWPPSPPDVETLCRPPRGGRGLKFAEILATGNIYCVAPLAGGVD